jgi:hypothetical protein
MEPSELPIPTVGPTKVKVSGTEYSIDILRELHGGDLAERIAALTLLLAEAQYQQHRLDSEFKVVRSAALLGLAKKADLPEWKLKLRFEASDEFAKYQEGICQAERTVNVLRAAIASLHFHKGISSPL